MKYKVKGELSIMCSMNDLLSFLLSFEEIPILSIKRKNYIVEFIINTTSEKKLKDIIQKLAGFENFRLLKNRVSLIFRS